MKNLIFYLIGVLVYFSPASWGVEDKKFESYKISDQYEVHVSNVKGNDGIEYSDNISVIKDGKVIKKKDFSGHVLLNDENNYLALIPCPGVWCSNVIHVFEVPSLKKIKTETVPDGLFIMKMGWVGSQLRIKYGDGLRKNSKIRVIDIN